jgi:hypothetical protein
VIFRNKIIFTVRRSAPRPTSNLEGHPLSAFRGCLLSLLVATLHTCLGDKKPFLFHTAQTQLLGVWACKYAIVWFRAHSCHCCTHTGTLLDPVQIAERANTCRQNNCATKLPSWTIVTAATSYQDSSNKVSRTRPLLVRPGVI